MRLALAAYVLGVLEISLGNYGAAVECLRARRTPTTRRSSGPRHCPTWWRPPSGPAGATWQRRALQRLADRATATGTPLALGSARPIPGPARRPGRGPARSTRRRCTCSAGPGPLRSWPAPTCSTASGCAASAGGGRRATSCARPSTCSRPWACDCFAERARVRAAGHRRARPEAGDRDARGAHPPGGADRGPGEPGRGEPGDRRPAVRQPEHRGVPPAQGVPEARRDLSHPARPPRLPPGLRHRPPDPASERPLSTDAADASRAPSVVVGA